jgi:hypothetical protein
LKRQTPDNPPIIPKAESDFEINFEAVIKENIVLANKKMMNGKVSVLDGISAEDCYRYLRRFGEKRYHQIGRRNT